MKKALSLVVCVAAGLMLGIAEAGEYGENDYTGTVSEGQNEMTSVLPEASQAAPLMSSGTEAEADESGVKCFRRYRYCSYYWYRPTVYYYRPVYYYRTYSYTRYYSYRCRYICFYKSFSVKSATDDTGVLMDEAPEAGTPLAAQGIQKGDVITHVDGKVITNPAQLDEITATSKLVVLKVNGGTNASGALAPQVPAVSYEYGAFEY